MENEKIRIGHGYDVHKLEKGERFIIGGIEIDHYKVIGGEHSWPSLNSNSDKEESNGDIDSDRIIWEFLSRFDINGLR